MYIYHNQMFLYKKYGPTGPCHIMVQQNRLTSLIKNGIHMYHTIKGPLGHPLLPLPPEEVVAHLYPPQAVAVEHLQDHPAQEAGVH
jgi:hypothetical protein